MGNIRESAIANIKTSQDCKPCFKSVFGSEPNRQPDIKTQPLNFINQEKANLLIFLKSLEANRASIEKSALSK